MDTPIKVKDIVRAHITNLDHHDDRFICVTALNPYSYNVHLGISIPEGIEVHFWGPTAEVIGHAD